MVRLACIDVADLPLQLLLRKHPSWRDLPAAVVSKDSPYGTILSVNIRAGEYGIREGQRYASGLSLNHELRADTVSGCMIREGLECLLKELRNFSPQVEASESEPGVFWLDAAGMSRLFPDLRTWCSAIRDGLKRRGFAATVAVGFTRFGSYAAAKTIRDQVIFCDRAAERKHALAAGAHLLQLPAGVRERLEMLGIHTIASFLKLPAGGVGKRFGAEVLRLHRFASGDLDLPLQPAGEQAEPQIVQNLPCAEPSAGRLLGYLRGSIKAVAEDVCNQHRLIRRLNVCFLLEGEEFRLEPIIPASPCADPQLLTDLTALRLENMRLPDAVLAIRLSASTVTAEAIQTELFNAPSSESRRQADKVFSRLRAVFGNSCIQRACLQDEHSPERSYSWEDMSKLPRTAEAVAGALQGAVAGATAGALQGAVAGATEPLPYGGQLVRRILHRPVLSRPLRMRRWWGPYPLSGRWWRGEQTKHYYFAETGEGEILWLYREGADGHWRQIGMVE